MLIDRYERYCELQQDTDNAWWSLINEVTRILKAHFGDKVIKFTHATGDDPTDQKYHFEGSTLSIFIFSKDLVLPTAKLKKKIYSYPHNRHVCGVNK